ncbi:MAG: archease [Deltaproteobacteria bacterium]|nr:archease [Deltaproteobacteria bacterium]
MMPYTYLEHTADIGIRAEGRTLREAVEAGAEAVFNVMFDCETIKETSKAEISANAGTAETLFVETINELLSIQDRDSLALKRFVVEEIIMSGPELRLKGIAYGEPFDSTRHMTKTEVKAATYAGLSYRCVDNEHVLECVLDV